MGEFLIAKWYTVLADNGDNGGTVFKVPPDRSGRQCAQGVLERE
jgi:hypothetical protein